MKFIKKKLRYFKKNINLTKERNIFQKICQQMKKFNSWKNFIEIRYEILKEKPIIDIT